MTNLNFSGIIDSTLREGEQTTGVYFSPAQKLDIVRNLVEIGVEEIELGIASHRNQGLAEFVHTAKQLTHGKSLVSLWSRCIDEDIHAAAQCRPDILSLSIPVSDIHITHKLRRNRDWVLASLQKCLRKSRKLGIREISVGLEDATRADSKFLEKTIKIVEESGAARIRLADTVGITSPQEICKLASQVKHATSLPIGVHTHNDFGMATANAIAALEAGVQWIDATVLGLGERAGNCRLEEVVGYLSLQKGVARYRPEGLNELCSLVATAADIPISPYHPLVGNRIFTCETGLHVQGLMLAPQTYEPYSPDRIGRRRSLLFGRKTGKSAVQKRLQTLGVTISAEQADTITDEIRNLQAPAMPLADEQLMRLAAKKVGCN